jgi:hypothetical protein
VKFIRITKRDRAAFQARLAALEKLATYPLGADTFQLDHGPDYFAFFDRLGDVLYLAVLDGDALAAVGCGMLRRVPLRHGERPTRTWYAADLKVHPHHRGERLPLKMVARNFLWNYLRCPRLYGITMNPDGGGENRIVRLAARWRWTPVGPGPLLNIWSFDRDAMRRVLPIIERHRGPVRLRSLEGVKDLVLGSTGGRLPLLHAEWGEAAPGGALVDGPQPDHVHMACAPEGDPLTAELRGLGLAPGATATIVHHRMGRSDWRFVLTSEI